MSTTRITDNDYADVALYDKVNAIANEIDNEVSKKANSSNTVTTDTTQTIRAKKIFTGDIVRSIDIDVAKNPTSPIYIVPYTADNADQSVRGFQQISLYENGLLKNTLGLRRTVNGSNVFSSIELGIDSNGNTSSGLQNLTTNTLTATNYIYRPTGVNSKVNPSTYKEVVLLDAKDTNGIINSSIRTGYRTDGTIDTIIYTGKDGNAKPFVFRMMYDGTPVMLGQTPRISASGVEVPTAAWVKSVLSSSGNGLATLISNAVGDAIKFTNGLIMQWGESQANKSKMTITLPTAFTSGDSYQVFTQYIDGHQSANNTYIENQTATSFQWDRYGGISQFKVSWFAIGY